jgi:hypothetical protein
MEDKQTGFTSDIQQIQRQAYRQEELVVSLPHSNNLTTLYHDVRVPGYTTEMYCASCEVRTEFIYVM